jgi:hypothetical protein
LIENIDIDAKSCIEWRLNRYSDYAVVLFILIIFSCVIATQESATKTGACLGSRAPCDPRPFEESHIVESFFLGANIFQTKNKCWREEGFVLGGYISFNAQAGSEDSGMHWMSESLIIGAWLTFWIQS